MNHKWWIDMLKAAAPELDFDWLEADDESVDDQLELIGTRVTVQLGDGYVAINEDFFHEDGSLVAVAHKWVGDYNPESIPEIVAQLRSFERFKQ